MPTDPISAWAWERIKGCLKAEKTGNITLHVKDGKVLAWDLTEYGRAHPQKEQGHE